MRIGNVIRSLVSGSVLYAAMAACGAAESANAPRADGPTDAASAFADAFVDELGNPVGDAHAGPLAPMVFDEPCDKSVSINGTATGKGAIHSFPGKSVNDLAALRAVLPTPGIAAGGLSFDRTLTTEIFLADGMALVVCTSTATFILPQ